MPLKPLDKAAYIKLCGMLTNEQLEKHAASRPEDQSKWLDHLWEMLEQDNELPDVYKKVAVAAKDEKKEADWKADVQKAASDKGDGSVGEQERQVVMTASRAAKAAKRT